MEIRFNPRVSGKFVELILKQDEVLMLLENTNLSEEQRHNITKAISICTLKKFKVDINKIINNLKEFDYDESS